MRVHSISKIEQMKKMRQDGHSIMDLMKVFSLPKTTVWHHVHSIKLSKKQKDTLRSRQGGGEKWRKIRCLRAHDEAVDLLSGSKREASIILAMLYWAEGTKKNSCTFTNSDGRMIKLYIKLMKEVLSVQVDDISITIRIFSGMSKRKCLNYWANTTKKPISEIVTRLNDGGTRGKTPFGMCRVVVKKGSQSLKIIHALIDLVFTERVI